MLGHLLRALRRLFPSSAGRVEVSLLVLVMAAVPVVELLVIRLFSDLVIDGPQRWRSDDPLLLWQVAGFFLAMAGARGMHHLVRIARVSRFRRRFEELEARSPSRQSWDWALALELSTVLVSIVQTAVFCIVFFVLDPLTAAVNVVVVLAVMTVLSRLYARELGRQQAYVASGTRPGSAPVSDRVSGRIRIAEVGAAAGSLGMGLVLLVVLFRTLEGQLSSADAIVFFLGSRLLYGQLGAFSAGIMRFSRAAARTDLVAAA